MQTLVLATRKSPLALAQSELVAARLREAWPECACELLRIVTTGDARTEWALDQRGGKGLFTKELEQALLDGRADLAVHSCKDLPGEEVPGLEVAGFLPREDPRDVLILREGVESPRTLASDSPRRRAQVLSLFPDLSFTGIRGNVDTRLRKIAEGAADATILAAAGLRRLGIAGWPGLVFLPLDFAQMVPAVGQGAIAVQTRSADAARFAAVLDARTRRAVELERAFQRALGAGCHLAFAAHVAPDTLYLFHEEVGLRSLPLADADFVEPAETVSRVLNSLGLR